MKNNTEKNDGFSLIMLIVLVAVIALVSVWYSFYNESASPLDISKITDTLKKSDGDETETETETEVPFEDIPEDEFTPVEVNNKALEELDSIMESITEEDLSDLSDL